ncbi:MAG: hypothetical protein HYV07_25585 [Deltaproteobacteria bacterium]|nr:hypothetical protein [Deltaproteobacteria bacterium]
MSFSWSAKLLLLVHSGLGVVLLGAIGHFAILSAGALRGRPIAARFTSLYARWTFWLFFACVSTGALAYPSFRSEVRPFFDAKLPWATGLFEVKEHFGALGLFASLAIYVACRDEKPERWVHALVLIVAALTLYLGGVGSLLVSIKST